MLHSLAVEGDGGICVGMIGGGGIIVVGPVGRSEVVRIDDAVVTNLCFGGAERRDVRTAGARSERLLKGPWQEIRLVTGACNLSEETAIHRENALAGEYRERGE
ncbi:SMP-30/gluconolactonase/LRE family protein [Sphingobium yanoikuyae]|uniref:Uncharacterized protein n=1 Tax=Sphingobium yanoikuyae TaxID=13690 RepID=A0A291N069_SPHYA|nr:SMP-30/gluconolactonase/LRE family protein [Sphingobium yanoikuyae]ATI80739.1 hypothetical protein A6768_12540 [Sphingobium yanoikuyae]